MVESYASPQTRNIAVMAAGVITIGLVAYFTMRPKAGSTQDKTKDNTNDDKDDKAVEDVWQTTDEEDEADEPVVKKKLFDRKPTGYNRSMPKVDGDDE